MAKAPEKITLTSNQVLAKYQNEKGKFDAVTSRINVTGAAVDETIVALQAVRSIKNIGKNNKIMVSLGGGVFTDATLLDTNKLKLTIPGNVVTPATTEKTIKELEKRLDDLKKNLAALIDEQKRAANNLRSLEGIINQMGRPAQQQKEAPAN